MNIKQILNKAINFYSYFHRKTFCYGHPEVFNIELTNSCPYNCVMCPRRAMKRKIGSMNFELFKKIIDQLNGCSYAIWLHHFGESLLHPELKKFIDYAAKKGIKTQLSINPTLLTEKTIEKISNLDYLHISLDGATEKTYKKLRGRNTNFKQAVENIKKFLKQKGKKPYTVLAIIRMKETEVEISDFKKQWDLPGIDEIEIKEFTTWDGSQKAIINLAKKEQLSVAFRKQLSYPCLRPWHRFTILWDGLVVPCCYDYDAKFILGDLKEETLKHIWNNKKMRLLRRQHVFNNFRGNKLCKDCKEKLGMPASKSYPLNIIFLRRALRYAKQKLK